MYRQSEREVGIARVTSVFVRVAVLADQTLIACRDSAAALIGIEAASLGLSMGMSHDFEQAIEYGAGYIRPGSTIFGARTYSNAGKK